jgi:predicted RNA binding protein YcfA (HicA-like mRNA interferase family)
MMAQISRLIAEFLVAKNTFDFRNLEKILAHLGYQKLKPKGGSMRRYVNAKKQLILLHEPHDGVMTRSFIERLRNDLKERGEI